MAELLIPAALGMRNIGPVEKLGGPPGKCYNLYRFPQWGPGNIEKLLDMPVSGTAVSVIEI